jgi:hypothetical protein
MTSTLTAAEGLAAFAIADRRMQRARSRMRRAERLLGHDHADAERARIKFGLAYQARTATVHESDHAYRMAEQTQEESPS